MCRECLAEKEDSEYFLLFLSLLLFKFLCITLRYIIAMPSVARRCHRKHKAYQSHGVTRAQHWIWMMSDVGKKSF